MKTEKEIKTKWKKQHDTLSESYYNGTSGLSKAEFDSQHGAIWEMMESELIEAGFKHIPIPLRNLGKELDDLKEKVAKLEKL